MWVLTGWALLKISPILSSLLFVAFCSTAVNEALVSWLSQGSDRSAANSIQLQYTVVDHLQGTNCSFDALREWARCMCMRMRVYACAYGRAYMHTIAVHRHTFTQRRARTHTHAHTHTHTVHSRTRQRGIEAPKIQVAEIKCAECPGIETCAIYLCVHVHIALPALIVPINGHNYC